MTSSQLASHTIFTSVNVTWVLQGSSEGNCSGHFRVSSSPNDLQCIAVCEVDSSDIQYKYHSLAEWACCRVTDSTLLLHGRPRLSYREHHWIAPMRLTAAQPGPWLRPVNLQPLSEQTKTDPASHGTSYPLKKITKQSKTSSSRNTHQQREDRDTGRE